MDNQDSTPLITLKWTAWNLLLFEKFIRIERKGINSFFIHWLAGKKDIYFKNISAIQVKKPWFTTWYIQFSIMWWIEAKWWVLAAVSDENTMAFMGTTNYENALKIKEHIENTIESNNSSNNTHSDADELEKLHALVGKWIITQEEYDTKKKLILGI